MERNKSVAYTGLHKTRVIVLVVIFGILLGGIVLFTLFSSNGSKEERAREQAANVAEPVDLNVTVDNAIHVQKSDASSVVLPPVPTDPKLAQMGAPNSLGKDPAGQQQVAASAGPQMFTVGGDAANKESPNGITKTDTGVGTGTIDSQYKTLSSPYTIFAGSFIPATLVTGINSDLDGLVTALVRNDVYDTVAGKYLLVPQGSKLIGTYNHDIAYGQNRLMIGWNRLIFPNGTSVLLHGQPGTDLQGFSGFSDEVNNHYTRIFGSAFLMGAIFGGTSLAVGNQSTNPYQLSAGATMANQVGAQMSQVGLQIISKGLNVAPTLIIHPGYKFFVAMTADLVLKPYIYKNKGSSLGR
jgi:type IV secretion system protein TrbI